MSEQPKFPVRRSPFHHHFADRGAKFGGTDGWQYPEWFVPPGSGLDQVEATRREQRLVRNAVGVLDLTVLSDLLLVGAGALAVLNWLSTSDVDVPIGRVVYTQWCSDAGTILVDLVVYRQGHDRFLVMVNDTLHDRVEQLVNDAIESMNAAASCVDVSSAIATLVVTGPLARHVMQTLTSTSLASADFPPLVGREIEITGIPVTAMRVSFSGELTWELHVASELGDGLAGAVLAAVEDVGGGPIGMDAMYALGTESGMLDYHYSIDDSDSLLEAGLGFTIAWDKASFRGRAALHGQRAYASPKRTAFICSPISMEIGDQIQRNGSAVGRVRTVSFGTSIGSFVGACVVESKTGVTNEWIRDGSWTVGSRGAPATMQLRGLYDPTRARARG